jgi:hypothetical protein
VPSRCCSSCWTRVRTSTICSTVRTDGIRRCITAVCETAVVPPRVASLAGSAGAAAAVSE